MTATTVTSTVQVVGTAIFSDQPEVLVGFYERVFGLELDHRLHADGREHWVTDLAGVHFEVKATRQANGAPTPDAIALGSDGHSNIEISLMVDDVDSVLDAALAAGAAVHQPVAVYDWGTFGVVLDPDGNRLGIYTPSETTDTSSSTKNLGDAS